MSACGDYTMPFAFFPCVDRYGRQLEDWPTCSDRKFLYETTTKRRKVDLRVEASAPVEVYIVQESDLDNWKAGDSYEGWSFPTAKATRAQLIFPAAFEKDWYLVLRNPGDKVAGVHYELFDV
jgi:hypothetical protein